MIQADLFCAYGIGATLAAGAGLEPSAGPRARPGALHRALPPLAYFALVFAPVATALTLAFPSWQTMHVLHRVPWWLVLLAAAGYVAMGMLGYASALWLVPRGPRWAYLPAALGYGLMFFVFCYGWDGTGYRRVLSATDSDLAGWPARSLAGNVGAWLGSGVPVAVAVAGAVLVVPQLVMVERSFVRGLREAPAVTIRAARLRAASFLGVTVVLALAGAAVGTALAATTR